MSWTVGLASAAQADRAGYAAAVVGVDLECARCRHTDLRQAGARYACGCVGRLEPQRGGTRGSRALSRDGGAELIERNETYLRGVDRRQRAAVHVQLVEDASHGRPDRILANFAGDRHLV